MPLLDTDLALTVAASVAIVYAALLAGVLRAVRSDDEALSELVVAAPRERVMPRPTVAPARSHRETADLTR